MKANHQIVMNMLMKVVHHFIQIIHNIHLFILVVKEDLLKMTLDVQMKGCQKDWLRIHFADFPCLHCSIDQRLFTLET